MTAIPSTCTDAVDVHPKFFAALLNHRVCEHAVVAHLCGAGRLIGLTEISGTEDGIILPLRAIVADALNHDARSVLLAHNHPSGDPRPSQADIETTRMLVAFLQALDIRVHDHLIVARGGAITSFRDLGWL